VLDGSDLALELLAVGRGKRARIVDAHLPAVAHRAGTAEIV
jgi:hypothetical protein